MRSGWAIVGFVLASAAPALAGPRPAPPPTQVRALHSTVAFERASAGLGEHARGELDGVVTWLGQEDDREVVVEADAGWVGQPDYDSSLARHRAMQVKRYLVAHGIDPERVLISTPGDPIPETNGGSPMYLRTIFVTSAPAAPAMFADPPSRPEAESEVADPAQPGGESADLDALDLEELDERSRNLWVPGGMSVSLGAGVMGLLDQQANDFAQVGGSWEARLTYGTRRVVAFEAGYFGSAQEIDALGLASDAVLLGNGVEGNVRVNFTTAAVQSYVFGGAGWTRFELARTPTNTSSIEDHDDVLHTPFGAGFGYRLNRALFDVRATIRPAFVDDMFDAPFANSDLDAKMTTWNVAAKLGFEF